MLAMMLRCEIMTAFYVLVLVLARLASLPFFYLFFGNDVLSVSASLTGKPEVPLE